MADNNVTIFIRKVAVSMVESQLQTTLEKTDYLNFLHQIYRSLLSFFLYSTGVKFNRVMGRIVT